MAMSLQPPPRRHAPFDPTGAWFSRVWDQWFEALSRLLNTGSIPWSALDFTSSSHNNIVTAQGGSATERYHLLASEHAEIQRSDNVASIAADTTLGDTHRTALVTESGTTITLPAASSARIGRDWTVALTVAGYATVRPGGSDELVLEDSPIVIEDAGTNVTLRCISVGSWVLV
jgi:hypothetical protein